MKKVLVFAFILLVFTACDKNQRAVKKLDGEWKATEATTSYGGASYDLLADGWEITATFTKCKLKDEEWCTMTTTTTDPDGNGTTSTDVFRVTNDGTTLETKDDASSSTISTITIDELTGSTLKTSSEDGSFTSSTTYEKQ